MTQEELAGILQIVPDTLSRMEKGRFTPKMSRLPDITQALNCSVADLFREADVKAEDGPRPLREFSNLFRMRRKKLWYSW